jgi:pseudaminic acid biosynthesis-associated methylase
MIETKQQKFWESNFGKAYTKRNTLEPKALDISYSATYGMTRSRMNQDFLSGLKINNILEVGCNIGNQLRLLQKQGYENLYGLELQYDAVEKAKKFTKEINIVQGSAFDLPFKDGYFDLVFTSGLLIHISQKDIKRAMTEIYRVARRYIWGFEYFSERYQEIEYRGHEGYLWKNDFCSLFLKYFPDLKLIKKKQFKRSDNGKTDEMYLLKKII